AVADRITALNQAIVSVCQQYTNCGTDGGAIYRLWSTLTPSNLTFDYFHLSEAGQALVAASSWNAGLFVAPSNSTALVIRGTAQQGQTLSVSTGSWTGSPTSFAYAWKDCDSGGGNCSPIGGATLSTYQLGAGDVGHTIVATVTASNAAGPSSPAASN